MQLRNNLRSIDEIKTIEKVQNFECILNSKYAQRLFVNTTSKCFKTHESHLRHCLNV